MKYHVILSAKAMKTMDRLDRKMEQRIQARLDELGANPFEQRIAKQMETAEFRRYSRVGDWRIVYEVDLHHHKIIVITIQHRSRVYKEVKK